MVCKRVILKVGVCLLDVFFGAFSVGTRYSFLAVRTSACRRLHPVKELT